MCGDAIHLAFLDEPNPNKMLDVLLGRERYSLIISEAVRDQTMWNAA